MTGAHPQMDCCEGMSNVTLAMKLGQRSATEIIAQARTEILGRSEDEAFRVLRQRFRESSLYISDSELRRIAADLVRRQLQHLAVSALAK